MMNKLGVKRTRELLEAANADLTKRLGAIKASGSGRFTETQLKATQAQVEAVMRELNSGLLQTLSNSVGKISERAAQGTIDYLNAADAKFRGVGQQPLALDEGLMFDRAEQGARASLLYRLSSGGRKDVKNADPEEHKAKQGILERYGEETVKTFEDILQRGMVTRKPWAEMEQQLREASPFLKGAPASWAERIVRTETMGAYNRASWESNREADEQLDDVLKVISCVFDDRTGSDSFAVHGQVRRPDEPFQSWYGYAQHPPDRPNDRGVVVPFRMSWEFPKYLRPRSAGEIMQRWRMERRKGSPPPRPLMSTVKIPGVRFPTD